jgi:hypothetical protein
MGAIAKNYVKMIVYAHAQLDDLTSENARLKNELNMAWEEHQATQENYQELKARAGCGHAPQVSWLHMHSRTDT